MGLPEDIRALLEEPLDLVAAATLLGQLEDTSASVEEVRNELDGMGAELVRRQGGTPSSDPLEILNAFLFDELGFRGNQDDYYDPRNSFLGEVIRRRTGLPITLALVYVEVGRRAGLELSGVGFPG
ncbi:MAG: transglutaminase-like domain-containing protein, partial [Thermoplasmata archaeon]|nr:transglutaminase-like domain-containing protein [Thermoplasmata archaeon]